MPQTPKVKLKKDGTRIIDPDFRLKEKVGSNIGVLISLEKIKKAEAIIDEGKKNFHVEMLKEMEELEKLFENACKFPKPELSAFRNFSDKTLNIKSASGIFGYPLATEISRSLYEFLITHSLEIERNKKISVVHLDALRTVFSKNLQGSGGELESQLIKDLKQLTGLE